MITIDDPVWLCYVDTYTSLSLSMSMYTWPHITMYIAIYRRIIWPHGASRGQHTCRPPGARFDPYGHLEGEVQYFSIIPKSLKIPVRPLGTLLALFWA